MNSGAVMFAACGIPDRLYGPILALFVAIAAVFAAITWLGVWMIAKGWQRRVNVKGKAQLAVGIVLTLIMAVIWVGFSSPFVLSQ